MTRTLTIKPAPRAGWGQVKARLTAMQRGESLTVMGIRAALNLLQVAKGARIGLSRRDLHRSSKAGKPHGVPYSNGVPFAERVFVLTRTR